MLIKLVLQSDCGCGCYSMKRQAVHTHTLRNILCPLASISSLPKHLYNYLYNAVTYTSGVQESWLGMVNQFLKTSEGTTSYLVNTGF